MFDSRLRSYVDPVLNKIAETLDKKDISPNTVTFTGFMVAVFCFIALIQQAYILALIFLIANRIADGLDGVLAHHIDSQKNDKKGKTDLGSFLDIVFDMLFYGGFVFFFAWGRPDIGDAAAFLLFCFLGTSSSFLAQAILVEKSGAGDTTSHQNKGFFYAYGLIEGSETIFCFVLMCLFPQHFNILATGFGLLCLITTIARIKSVFETYKDRD